MLLKKAWSLTSDAVSLLRKHYPKTGYAGRSFMAYYQTDRSQKETLPDRSVVFVCDGKKRQGGLGDRLKGLLTTYGLAKQHGRPFYIYWCEPFRLEEYLCPNKIDWRVDFRLLSFSKQRSFPVVLSHRGSKWRLCVETLIFRCWFYGKKELHVYTNYVFSYDYPTLFKDLFCPSEIVDKQVDEIRKIGGGNYWSFSFRFMRLLGDFEDNRGETLPEKERPAFMDKNIAELKSLLQQLPPGYKALVTSDSITFLERAQKADERIFIVPGRVVHPDHITSNETTEGMFLKSFVDFFLIMEAEKVFLLQTGAMYKSGFPELAASLGKKEFIHHRF